MTAGHLALVVEDDRSTAEDLVEILGSLECIGIIVDNKRDALAEFERRDFCFVLLDLEIKLESGSIKGHTEHGNSLLREIRQTHADHPGRCHWLPILIVSGFAREVAAAVEAMKDGANDVIQKPFNGRLISEAIRRALERSGRLTHEACTRSPISRIPSANGKIVLAIPGNRIRRRTRVMVGTTPIVLPDSTLKVLLQLMVGYEAHTTVHKTDLGAREEQGFRGISVLREALKPALGEGLDVIENDYQGNYWLTDRIIIGDCDTEKLAESDDKKIIELARELKRILNARSPKSDGNT